MLSKIKIKVKNFLLSKIRQFYKRVTKDETNPLRQGKERKFIFIHINKTAGSSIAPTIGLTKKNHMTAKEVIDFHEVGQIGFAKAYKFTVVRNPWDRVLSQYKYRIKTNQCNMKEAPISFEEWVKKVFRDKDPFYYSNPKMFLPQVEWLKDYNNEINMDRVVRFENLSNEMNLVLNDLGIDKKLPHYNKTKKVNYREHYDKETQNIISDWFRDDIDEFGYSF
ncbi:MAG: hypothetical protein CMC76_02855 [Flavobacteriaceae bacterium]|nr:hypothetical protein [Flavobacteriaceae bacterium]|tara:strand:+ start:429 stop:1094 length:666 start_codon:yes stop_codon:yes gene_type:complete